MPIENPHNPDANPLCDFCGNLLAKRIGGGYVCEGCQRELLGRLVREVWVAYCLEIGDYKPTHLALWDMLSESDKEVDRRIGEAVGRYVIRNGLYFP